MVHRNLTGRQQQVLDFIAHEIAANWGAPTMAEIARRFGFASPNAAQDHVNALERKGMIERRRGHARCMRLTALALHGSRSAEVA